MSTFTSFSFFREFYNRFLSFVRVLGFFLFAMLLAYFFAKNFPEHSGKILLAGLSFFPVYWNQNVFSLWGGYNYYGDIYSLFGIFQFTPNGDACSIFGITLFQKAKGIAFQLIGISLYQCAGEEAVQTFGVSVIQKSGKVSLQTFGILIFQKANDIALQDIGIRFRVLATKIVGSYSLSFFKENKG